MIVLAFVMGWLLARDHFWWGLAAFLVLALLTDYSATAHNLRFVTNVFD